MDSLSLGRRSLLGCAFAMGLAMCWAIGFEIIETSAARAEAIYPSEHYRITQTHLIQTDETVRCANSQITLNERTVDPALSIARVSYLWAANAQSVFVTQRVGAHPTWILVLSFTDGRLTAYETYGMENDNRTVLFRQETPEHVLQAFDSCGVPIAGIWLGNAPYPRGPLPTLDPSDLNLLPVLPE